MMNPAGTLDKRRPSLRDELGYIAPPNRKLPPVPGSNYNTCDRIKRGAVISNSMRSSHSSWDPRKHQYEDLRSSGRQIKRNGTGETRRIGMEDEICPYATFHLLGFREEMDPTKAGLNFQTFPHGNGMPHAGTMGPPHHNSHNIHSRSGSQSMPRQNNRYARKNSQGGNSSIYTPGPEYDDPANCAEEDQYRNRYSRPSYGRAGGPEYDDPASCAPEDDQYTGQYGTPYEHYGSRPSFAGSGRNMSASPEPPPPPPRNQHPTPNGNGADPNGSSFNDSKDSNEISEAECDQPRALSVRAHNTKDGMTTEEMRKLIERNEATGPHQQFQSGGGLTTYDTVAV